MNVHRALAVAGLATAFSLAGCRASPTPEEPNRLAVSYAEAAKWNHEAFASSLCPYPKKTGFISGYECSDLTRERARCLAFILDRERASLVDQPDGKEWRDLDGFYEDWLRARCGVDESLLWVDLDTREWSDGTAQYLREDRCVQRMLEERLYFHASRVGRTDGFWRLVEARQAAGARVRAKLEQARAATEKPAVVNTDPIGSVRSESWRELVYRLDVALARPAILAQQHCRELHREGDCEAKLTLYFHSIGEDADGLDVCKF
ncbi:hypothetical protein [Vulgatibacter incomptus]|uniref:Lipoprotein n=1 Tax=Vulgatibacter incomptus TaxID=1391653 RepID=A0A0K1PGI7_9BACT|nr:hypothetical protein [Vulgatibacter incomptus]AKU92635.1 hypothetical protein AKJ08_3022 [Vulgatibacter incomptus]